MQIVIKMDEDYYNAVKALKECFNSPIESILIDTILSGKILPKGHGDLIDRNKLNIPSEEMIARVAVQCASVVIGADREVEE